ncbi:MAG: isocitrate/isopropylmalate dehydrogenase family protein [Candidatus Methanosuratincola sp.]|jgi:3-isopropylmalate dehydrogenase|uniref:3-isopropylmalate dehydrogenase n=1 Tax=Methanosuratincola subterraneus TaxID=2593994 RepID=A0A3S3RZI9_METS7|nr:isocitrate/isopropylmalate dehydrogenase family protein [Candidatus Methanosuratincola sp.]MCQ8892428.1 isocitrate/isopropylmalate dehydrogenase family protein [Candidatus Methanosuratincola sp.]RWX73083.1 MAG: 3-isopropylmalate dehydrogenase [Candidatus Methanosuratincola subterraneus]
MTKKYKIAVMPGDGIGPEQTAATLKILSAVMETTGPEMEFIEAEGGDETLKKRGEALPQDSIEIIKSSDACLKGPVGESAADVIVKLRILFDLYANLRPIKSYPGVQALRPDIDLLVVRENTEDLYKGYEFRIGDDTVALRVITKKGCHRIAETAFKYAMKRRKKVTAVHKANVLRVTDGLFRDTCREVAQRYPEVAFDELYIDAATMHLIKRPHEFDVICITNMFGDILSDEAAQIGGGLGMAAGANIGDKFGLFEPIHGSAPKHAGKNTANPISMILCSKMMLEWLGEEAAAKKIEDAVMQVLSERRVVTPDLGGKSGTTEVAEEISRKILGR